MEPARPRPAHTKPSPPQSHSQQAMSTLTQFPQHDPSQQRQFPPHPSVRVQPNVKLRARPSAEAVAEARTPVPRLRPSGSGILVQDFRFPAAPPIQPLKPSRARQDNMQSGAQASPPPWPLVPSTDEVRAGGMTPGVKPHNMPSPGRYSGSVYPESEALGPEERHGFGDGVERSPEPEQGVHIVRQASLGKRAKPAVTTIKNRGSHNDRDASADGSTTAPPSGRSIALNNLGAALAAGFSQHALASRPDTPGSRSRTPLRMPFDTSRSGSPLADKEIRRPFPPSRSTTVSARHPDRAPGSGHSHKSTNPLLGLGIEHPSMSDRIPESRRPPRLDLDAVRELENRGSTTSLAELIRRATKLAANLDRGKTASRLGMLDMFGSSEKLGGAYRQSTMSDMISAFPAPATGGTPTNRRDGAWPLGEKGDAYASTIDLSKPHKNSGRRRCCGLSLPVFCTVLVVLILLIAAAVLIPIFLVLVPNQRHHSADGADCAQTNPCGNGGTVVAVNGTCGCICANDFTGSQCESPGSAADCISTAWSDGQNQYSNATMGRSILPALSDAEKRFNVPLNATSILFLFTANNLTCTSENSLMDFNSTSRGPSRQAKRFLVVPGVAPYATQRPEVRANDDRWKRQDSATVGTSNGIVFQATSTTTGPVADPTASVGSGVLTASVGGAVTATVSTTASASANPIASAGVDPSSTTTSDQVDFARVVVLYALQESRAISAAVGVQQRMVSFFSGRSSSSKNSTIDIGLEALPWVVDLTSFTITTGDGQVVSSSDK